MKNVLSLTIEQLSKQLRAGSLFAKEVCQICLKRAEQTKQLNSFIALCEESSLMHASGESDIRLKSGKSKSLLQGIPIAIKDNFCTKGVRTTCGSAMLADFIPPYNATERDMQSGTTDSLFGPTINVFGSGIDGEDGVDSPRVAGGSSGGRAVAVASAADLNSAQTRRTSGIGSDTGGSTRSPTSYCGIIGFKPTYGHISRYGLIPLVNSIDAAIIYDSLKGVDDKDGTSAICTEKNHHFSGDVKGLTVGIPVEFHCEDLHPEIALAWDQAACVFQDAGATLKQI